MHSVLQELTPKNPVTVPPAPAVGPERLVLRSRGGPSVPPRTPALRPRRDLQVTSGGHRGAKLALSEPLALRKALKTSF